MNIHSTQDKLSAMREGGMELGAILTDLLDFAGPGVTLIEIETLAQQRIQKAGMKPSFPTVADYKWATCLCVNDVIVHGMPTPYKLKEGDVLTIDIGLIHKKYHVDTAWTKIIRHETRNMKHEKEIDTFLETGKKALQKAVEQVRVGNRVGHISKAIQDIIEGAGFGVVRSLVGHGVGTTLHEPPQIPGYLKGSIEKTFPLTLGMTIAIEVIYTMGSPTVSYHEDGWSIATRDHSLSAVFEQTLAVIDNGPLVLTKAQK